MSAVRLCMLGCGAVARLHSRVARSLRPRVDLVYASRTREKAEAYARRYGGVGAFGSYEAACADAKVDAVLVCTPQAFHSEHAVLAARHGKGYFVYTSLAWFRQLPEGVPGAYRLFANLVSLGK